MTVSYTHLTKEISEGLKNNRYATLDWAETLVKVGTTLSQVTMGMTSINSMFSTFTNSVKEGEFTVEDFTVILTNFGMLLPTISTLFKKQALQNSLKMCIRDRYERWISF